MKRGKGPTRRVVLLGASNLSRGVAVLVALFRQGFPGDSLEHLVALGWGRSYVSRSRVLGRCLPGIPHCGLWRRLESDPGIPTFALLTDVGNDLAYGVQPEQIVEGVGTCITRLQKVHAKIVLALPPVERLVSLPSWRFSLIRALYFPRHGLNRSETTHGLQTLDVRLRGLAAETGVQVVPPESSWYGWDPIHLARSRQYEAWARIVAPFFPEPVRQGKRLSLRQRRRLLIAQPEVQWLFGVELHRRQPLTRWAEAESLWLY